jgi:hypothetical protein
LVSSSSQAEEEKKNHRKKKNAMKGGSLLSNFCFALSLLASCFCPFVSSTFSLASSFSQAGKNNTKKKKTIKKKKNVEKGRSLPFFSRFCIWDQALLLLSPLHIHSTLNSPLSSSLVSHVSSKLCATQA